MYRHLFHLILLYILFRLPRCRLPCFQSNDLLMMVDETVLNKEWDSIKGNGSSEKSKPERMNDESENENCQCC